MLIREIIECVPNFSAGKNIDEVNAIVESISSTKNVNVLHVDRGVAANRTVVTFAGDKVSVLEGAWQGVKKSAEVIDMRHHKGIHPRLGATDVCPFIPIENVTMADCIKISKKMGAKAAGELNIPVYLYEEAAIEDKRKNLANIRRGEYEGLKKKLEDPEWQPDFGGDFNPGFGAMVTGARKFLVAYNVNLNTSNAKIAKNIAAKIRTSGTDPQKEKDQKQIAGIFPELKAIGWFVEEYNCAQVSMNLTDYKVTPPHLVYEKISELAEKEGYGVTGSEVIGMILKEPLLEAGIFYLIKKGQDTNKSEQKIISSAIDYLGLNDVSKFIPEEKILEYKLEKVKSN